MPRPDDSRFGDPRADAIPGLAIGELIGQGGSGRVYRGTVLASGQHVAIKVLHDNAESARLIREAEMLKQLDHPGVASLIEVTEVDGRACLVTEWVEGEPLSHHLRSSAPLSPVMATSVFRQLAAALDHAHGMGVMHRDISPDNVMIGPDGSVTLIDFGLSRTADSATLTAAGVTAGTPRYLAPEVLEGADSNAASDAYSAAIILYEMLTGQWPYGDAGSTISTTMHHHLNSAPAPASEVNTWLPASIDAVFDKALSKDATERFVSVTALADAAEAASSGPRPGRSTYSNHSLTPARLIAIVVFAIAVLGLIAWSILRGGDDPAESTSERLLSVDAWASGTAASLPCNLLVGTDFADATIPENYYTDEADQNEPVNFGGVDQSPALRVGTTDSFGLYGETVAISPGVAYVFSAHVSVPADVDRASMRVFWLDENFDQVGDEIDLALAGTGQFSVVTEPSPDTARFAVPTLVKEASPGSLVVDELVFAARSAECAQQLVGG